MPDATKSGRARREFSAGGVVFRVIRRLPDVKYAFQWKGVLVFKVIYNDLVELVGEAPLKPQPSEIEDVRWFPAEAARKTISFKNTRETLDAAIDGLADQRKAS